MRYFKVIDEAYPRDWGGPPTFWLEVNGLGDAERQLEIYPNGNVLSYDRSHSIDDYGALSVMVIDGDETWWQQYEISQESFVATWNAHQPLNRTIAH